MVLFVQGRQATWQGGHHDHSTCPGWNIFCPGLPRIHHIRSAYLGRYPYRRIDGNTLTLHDGVPMEGQKHGYSRDTRNSVE